jgi:hypothetical protein
MNGTAKCGRKPVGYRNECDCYCRRRSSRAGRITGVTVTSGTGLHWIFDPKQVDQGMQEQLLTCWRDVSNAGGVESRDVVCDDLDGERVVRT